MNTPNPATKAPTPAKTSSASDPIACTVVKTFYDSDMRLVAEGTSPYFYTPSPDQPFPWPLLRPIDDKLADALEDEYRKARTEKLSDIRARKNAHRNLIAAAAEA